jgi:GNAT superfamily N-acetyltransferase
MPSPWIRPAQAADKPAVETLCAQIWEGEDYVPGVWDEWLADPCGQLAVAELEGQVVGFAKLSCLANDEWWLEELRADPGHRRQGVAGRLHAHLVEEACHIGRGVLRFGTHSLNEPIHRIAARDGFRRIATYRLYRADPLPVGAALSLRRLTGMDVPTAWALIGGSRRHQAASGLYETAWKWKNLTRERLAHHLGADDGWGITDGDELTALALACWVRDRDILHVGYVDGSEEALVTALRGLRGLAAQLDYTEVRFKPVDEPVLVAAAEASGYERSWDRDIWIFELPL